MLLNFVTIAGWTILVLAIIMAGYSWFRKGIPDQSDQDGYRPRHHLPGAFNLKLIIIMFVFGLVGMSMNKLIFYVDAGYYYLVQYPSGTQTSSLTPGFHARWMGETIPFKQYLTTALGGQSEEEKFSCSAPAQEIRFNDSVTATVRLTARFKLPDTPEQFQGLAIAFRSQSNLCHSSLIPIIQEALRNAGRMFSAQEYIGGRGGDFENAVLDQIRGGIYLLDVKEDRIRQGEQPITSVETPTVQQDQTVQLQVSIRRDQNGKELRKDAGENPLQKFGITLVQANIQDVDPDPGFKKKLEKQRDVAAEVSIERQNTRKQEQRKTRVIAEGEANKAEEQARLEKEQIQQVIAAETKAKMAEQEQLERVTQANTLKQEAEIERDRKAIELETAEMEKRRLIEIATGEAKARELKMKADNALEQRLAAFVQVSQAYAQALSDKQLVPGVVINGNGQGGNSNATDLISLLMAKAARDLGVAVSEREVDVSSSAK